MQMNQWQRIKSDRSSPVAVVWHGRVAPRHSRPSLGGMRGQESGVKLADVTEDGMGGSVLNDIDPNAPWHRASTSRGGRRPSWTWSEHNLFRSSTFRQMQFFSQEYNLADISIITIPRWTKMQARYNLEEVLTQTRPIFRSRCHRSTRCTWSTIRHLHPPPRLISAVSWIFWRMKRQRIVRRRSLSTSFVSASCCKSSTNCRKDGGRSFHWHFPKRGTQTARRAVMFITEEFRIVTNVNNLIFTCFELARQLTLCVHQKYSHRKHFKQNQKTHQFRLQEKQKHDLRANHWPVSFATGPGFATAAHYRAVDLVKVDCTARSAKQSTIGKRCSVLRSSGAKTCALTNGAGAMQIII